MGGAEGAGRGAGTGGACRPRPRRRAGPGRSGRRSGSPARGGNGRRGQPPLILSLSLPAGRRRRRSSHGQTGLSAPRWAPCYYERVGTGRLGLVGILYKSAQRRWYALWRRYAKYDTISEICRSNMFNRYREVPQKRQLNLASWSCYLSVLQFPEGQFHYFIIAPSSS